jgi:cellulose synthase/poly-beta-1,6-N-acetylglucosamine synthase-like glycosyltransferase
MEIYPDINAVLPFAFTTALVVFAALQLFWVLFFYSRVSFHNEDTEKISTPPISVIIAARNEEDNLFELLPFLLEQQYPEFEVIVINHQSIDDSTHILKALQKQYEHLKVIDLPRNQHLGNGKKLSLTIAIKGAKHEHLLFTDADCKPNSDYWINGMSKHFSEKKKLVLGYGPYKKKKGFLNKIIRLDAVFIAINYFAFTKAHVPYMGVGRNLAYTKTLFLENKGFKSHYALQSGDDDLFIQETAKNKNYTVCLDKNSFCYSEPKSTWSEWIKQKSRHFTTTSRYGVIKKLLLGIYPLTLLLLYASFITLLVNSWLSWISVGTIALVLILKWLIHGIALKKLNERTFLWLFPFWDLFYAILAPII